MEDWTFLLPLSACAVLFAFGYPYLFVRTSSANDVLWTFGIIDAGIGIIVGMAFAFWVVRMLPFINVLSQASLLVPPLGDAITAAAFLATSLLRRSPSSQITRRRNATSTYSVKTLSKAKYAGLLFLASTYAAVESIVAGWSAGVKQPVAGSSSFVAFFTGNAIMAFTLGTFIVQTPCSFAEVVIAGVSFVTTSLAGWLYGSSTLRMQHLKPATFTVMTLTAGFSSGAYLMILVSDVIECGGPPSRRRRRVYCFGIGVAVCIGMACCWVGV